MPFLLAQAPPKVFHTPANWLNCSETGSKSTLVECQGHGRIYSITVSLRNDPQKMMRPAGEVVGASTLHRRPQREEDRLLFFMTRTQPMKVTGFMFTRALPAPFPLYKSHLLPWHVGICMCLLMVAGPKLPFSTDPNPSSWWKILQSTCFRSM